MLIDQADPFENPNNPPTCVHFPPAAKRRIWFTTFHRFPIHRTRHPTAKLQTDEMKGKRLTFFFFGVQQNKEADSCLMGRRRDVMLMGKAATISDTYWHFPFSSHCEGFPQAGARLLANFPWPTTWLDTTISYYRSKLCAASTVNYDRWPN